METAIPIIWKSFVEESFRELTETMLPIEIQSVRRDRNGDFSPDWAAEVSFQGEAKGSIALFMTEHVAEAIAHLFQGEEIAPEPENIRDVLGELCNLIAGGFKRQFREVNGISEEISVPRVWKTTNSSAASDVKEMEIWVLFQTNVGELDVRVRHEENGEAE